MPKTFTENQLNNYKQDGVFSPIPILSSDEAARYLALSNQLESSLGDQLKPVEISMQMHLCFRWAYDLATHPKVLNAVEDILGHNILIWYTTIFSKHPHDPAYVEWHRDAKYWWLDPAQVVTAWIALSNSSIANGCIYVVVGSHLNGILPNIETFAKDNLLTHEQAIPLDVKSQEATNLIINPVILNPGEMSLHNVRTIHGSKPNNSDEKRVGFGVRYTVPSVKDIGRRPKAILARGYDSYNNFDLVEPPVDRSIEESLRAYRELALLNDGIF
ncbi:phytanoyl-CoA dioxygenase family protein [Cylindrospermum sp. FACHB-282]|uniref:phytanoyl-CoA dioxygenase family protein n=1 Tax=Cylindrospermum sp. FACHB-282 TaxID=2692794 RepID=UPI00168772F3|nr:phytanoyl-CoA dioxygenase family protein [Cylindrospermum sp. FACHB-282]MBD2385855.1 phytanoyl-CoA dioxygenase family protein [Cylindrospermum sp. FACHB-282]